MSIGQLSHGHEVDQLARKPDTQGTKQGISRTPKGSHKIRACTVPKLWYQLPLLDMSSQTAAAVKPAMSRHAHHDMNKIQHIRVVVTYVWCGVDARVVVT
jgi:hypothetical protein